MAKKQRVHGPGHGNSSVQLPPDLIQHIATFVPNAADFFSYLTAFRTQPHVLGHLVHFERIAEAMLLDPRDLWPRFRVESAVAMAMSSQLENAPTLRHSMDTLLRHHVRAVEATVAVHSTRAPRSLLQSVMAHAHEVHVRLVQPSPTAPTNRPILGWASSLTRQITKLAIPASVVRDSTEWTILLAQLSSLNELEVSFDGSERSTALEEVLKALATSSRISSFHCTCPSTQSTKFAITPSMLQDMMQWLSQPYVRSFGFSHWSFERVEESVPQFYQAILATTSMTEVAIAHSRLPQLHKTFENRENSRPFNIPSIAFMDCMLTSRDIEALACGLRLSTSVRALKLSNNPSLEPVAVLALAQALPTTQLSSLTLSDVPLSDAALSALCAGVAATPSLRHFVLRHVACRGDSLQIIATYLPTMAQLRSVVYSGDTYGDRGCRQLFASTMQKPREQLRFMRLRTLDLSSNNITDVGATWLAGTYLPRTQLAVAGNRISKVGRVMCQGMMTSDPCRPWSTVRTPSSGRSYPGQCS